MEEIKDFKFEIFFDLDKLINSGEIGDLGFLPYENIKELKRIGLGAVQIIFSNGETVKSLNVPGTFIRDEEKILGVGHHKNTEEMIICNKYGIISSKTKTEEIEQILNETIKIYYVAEIFNGSTENTAYLFFPNNISQEQYNAFENLLNQLKKSNILDLVFHIWNEYEDIPIKNADSILEYLKGRIMPIFLDSNKDGGNIR